MLCKIYVSNVFLDLYSNINTLDMVSHKPSYSVSANIFECLKCLFDNPVKHNGHFTTSGVVTLRCRAI